MDSNAAPKDRTRLIQAFSPRSNQKLELPNSSDEIDILISTDVLSEGQNLQDCGILVNYDLHWNPTRMVQRAGRIDRIGSEFDTITIHNLFPDAGLERLLKLVQNLSQKIAQIDATGFLDASVLGETVHPRNFNTLRRIQDEDGTVIEEQEQFIELVSSEYLLQELKALLAGGAKEKLDSLPDGIHSGLHHSNYRGLFFYYTISEPNDTKQHFWRYYDIQTGKIIDNRFVIASLINCAPDTPRIIGEADVFGIQAKVQAHILESIQAQAALEAAPLIIEPIQQTVTAVLRQHLNNPALQRSQVRQAIKSLGKPMVKIALKRLQSAYQRYQTSGDISLLLSEILVDDEPAKIPDTSIGTQTSAITTDDLHLVCWEYVWS